MSKDYGRSIWLDVSRVKRKLARLDGHPLVIEDGPLVIVVEPDGNTFFGWGGKQSESNGYPFVNEATLREQREDFGDYTMAEEP